MTVWQMIQDRYPDALLADGFNKALLGVLIRPDPMPPLAVYDIHLMVEVLQEDGMEGVEAEEYLDYNTFGAYVGPTTPLYVEIRNHHLLRGCE